MCSAIIEQVNLPGTVDEHPNWRRKLPGSWEELAASPRLRSFAEMLNSAPAEKRREATIALMRGYAYPKPPFRTMNSFVLLTGCPRFSIGRRDWLLYYAVAKSFPCPLRTTPPEAQ